jgi:hypothetical protein
MLLITPVSLWASRIAGSEEDRAELDDARRSGRPTADEEIGDVGRYNDTWSRH